MHVRDDRRARAELPSCPRPATAHRKRTSAEDLVGNRWCCVLDGLPVVRGLPKHQAGAQCKVTRFFCRTCKLQSTLPFYFDSYEELDAHVAATHSAVSA